MPRRTLGPKGDVKSRTLGPKGDVKIIAVDATVPLDVDHAIVMLEALEINRLYSSDGTGAKAPQSGIILGTTPPPGTQPKPNNAREGALKFNINGQETSLSWATDENGKLKNQSKFNRQFIYLGKHEGNLDFNINLIETNDQTVAALNNAKQTLNLIASVSSFVPVYGNIASAGLSLLASITDFIRSTVHDDLEMQFLGSLGGQHGSKDSTVLPLNQGTYKILRQTSSNRDPDIAVSLLVDPLIPLQNDKTQVIVYLESIELDIGSHSDNTTLVFESTLGSATQKKDFSFSAQLKNHKANIEHLLGIKNKVLYTGNWNVGVPFSFSLALLNNTKEIEALKDVVAQSGTFAKALTDDKDIQSYIDNASKAAESLRSLMIEFFPKKTSIGKLSGIIAASSTVPDLSEASSIKLVDKLDTWQTKYIELESVNGGKAKLTLKIKKKPI